MSARLVTLYCRGILTTAYNRGAFWECVTCRERVRVAW